MKRITEILDYDTEQAEGEFTELESIDGDIEINNVTFRYGNRKPVLNNISFTIPKGKKVALVGESGSGKSTIAKLLLKYYEPENGEILIDGVDINELDKDSIRGNITIINQSPYIFNLSIKENLKFNNKNVSLDKLWDICKRIGLDHFIKTLPGTMDSDVTDNEAISSGQKQLLTIARGMVKDAPFLILDEATSNVDTRTEELVQVAMDKLMEGKTSFIIAHRLSTIKNADLILVMNEGNIIEQGTHDELLKKKGFYADLYNSQFQK